MSTCKYCGKDAGWFSHKHPECEEKHQQGLNDFEALVSAYFTQRAAAADISQAKNRLMKDAYLNEDDCCSIADKEIRLYTASIHRPFSASSMKLLDDFLKALGISFSKVNKDGAVDEFTKKLLRGFMVEYFTDRLTLPVAHQRCEKVLARFPMVQSNIEDAYYYVLNKAATNFLKDGILSDEEQRKIDDYVNYLSLPINNLPAPYQNSEISKIGQVAILKSVQKGVVPRTNLIAPIVLGKNESILWTYGGVNLYQEKVTREWVSRRGGLSFKVIKGVYYHTGRSKGRPVERSSMDFQGSGTLYVTNKNLIFYSQTKGVKVPFNKIIGLTPYTDGIEVLKDGANQKRMTMQGFDPWFLMNLLSQINNI